MYNIYKSRERQSNNIGKKYIIIFVYFMILHTAFGQDELSSEIENKNGIPDGCAIYKNFPLVKKIHGIDGALQLIQDVHFMDPSIIIDLLSSGAYPSLDPIPQHAVLRIIDNQGQVIEWEEFVSIAELVEVTLYPFFRQTYMITQDYSQGFGSYNGPITFFVEVINGRLKWVEEINKKTGEKKQITLMKSLKTDWKFDETLNGGIGKDILLISCRPDFDPRDDSTFTVSYIRFHFNGRDWIRLERKEKDYWEEGDNDFPDQTQFPRYNSSVLARLLSLLKNWAGCLKG